MEIMGGFIINFNSNYGHSMLMEFILEEILLHLQDRPRGPMDKAPDFESGDCRFESCRGRICFFLVLARAFYDDAAMYFYIIRPIVKMSNFNDTLWILDLFI